MPILASASSRCVDWYSGENQKSVTKSLERLEKKLKLIHPRLRVQALDILMAQVRGELLEITFSSGFNSGRVRGTVTDFRIEGGYVKFDFNGETRTLHEIFEKRTLSVIRNPMQIIAQTQSSKFQQRAHDLLKAQALEGRVEITFIGFLAGKAQGVVSDVRIEDGLMIFDFNGKTYSLYSVGAVRAL